MMARHEKQLQDFFAAAQEYPRDLELLALPRVHSREADGDSGSGPRPFRAPYALRIRQGVPHQQGNACGASLASLSFISAPEPSWWPGQAGKKSGRRRGTGYHAHVLM